MRTRIFVVAILCGAVVLPLAAHAQPQPTVFGPRTAPPGVNYTNNLVLSATPPFVHWDLREFPDLNGDGNPCDVPWVLGPAPVPDLVPTTPGGAVDPPNSAADRTAATGAFAAAFGTWAAVAPSLIGFVNTPAPPAVGPATSGLTLDGFNTLNFGNANPGLDDIPVIPVGQGSANSINVRTGPNGVCNTAAGGDDVQLIPVGQGQPNQVAITDGGDGLSPATVVGGDDLVVGNSVTTGPDGICQSTAGGNDVQVIPVGQGAPGVNCVNTGPNGVSNTAVAGDDVQVIPVGQGLPNQICISPGGNGVLDTQPQGDDVVMGTNIVNGNNGITQSAANNQGTVIGFLGLAGLFFNNSSGVIMEADITFAPPTPAPAVERWVVNPATNVGGAVAANWRFNLQGVAAHEIGHFIGIAHPNMAAPGAADAADGVTPTMWGVVLPAFAGNNFNQTLENSDRDSCNFLYTPDLGDAPDLDNLPLAKFSTLVHGPNGRMLNGIQLDSPARGPLHKFGISRRQPARNYTYEWIGSLPASDVDAECEAASQIEDMDAFDDGVRFDPDPPVWGEALTITVDVRTALDAQGGGHNYGAFPLFVNLWIDLNTNGMWEEGGEHPINNVALVLPAPGAGSASGTVTLPLTLNVVWLRARLDWGEMVMPGGLGSAGLSPTLNLHEGAAQFGEDEDYPLACPRVPVWDFVWSNDPVDWGPGIWTKNGTEIGRTFPDGTSTGGTEPMHKSDHIEVPGEPNDWHWTADFEWNELPASVLVWFQNFGPADDPCLHIFCAEDHLDFTFTIDVGNDTYTLMDNLSEVDIFTGPFSGYPENLPPGFEPAGVWRCTEDIPPVCGDNMVNQTSESCDGTDDAACPGMCTADCSCPIPTVSEWSLVIMTVLAFTAGTILFGRRRRAAAA